MSQIDLNELAGGAMAERIAIELQHLAGNIADPNTKATAPRKLSVTITVTPDAEREIAAAVIDVKTSLAPATGIPTRFIIDQDSNGKAVIGELASGAKKNQLRIDDNGGITDHKGTPVEQDSKVVKFR